MPKQSNHLDAIIVLAILLGILIGLLLSPMIGYGQTYSKDNLSLYLDKKHQSIDTTGEYNKFVIQPKSNNMTFQVTILDYKPNKWFYLLLICIDHPMDSLKIHTFQGSELYNNLLFICETIYGDNTEDYIGTLDEELFLLRGDIVCKQAPSMKLNIGE